MQARLRRSRSRRRSEGNAQWLLWRVCSPFDLRRREWLELNVATLGALRQLRTGKLIEQRVADSVQLFGLGLRMIVFWNQASCIRLRKSGSILWPDWSPITDSLPHRGQRAVPALTASGLSKLLTSSPDQATISEGGKVCMQQKQPQILLASISAWLFVACRVAASRSVMMEMLEE